jgi:opacity protein-like surface antigen
MNISLSRTLLARACVAVLIVGASASAAAQTEVISSATQSAQGRAPTASDVRIVVADTNGDGFTNEGDTLTATYAFADADNDAQHNSAITWHLNGIATAITGLTYIIPAGVVGQPISYRLIAKTDPNITDPHESREYDSTNVTDNGGNTGEIIPTPPSTGLAVRIDFDGSDARPMVGKTLTATLTCAAGTGAVCGTNVSYVWERRLGSGNWTAVGTNTATHAITKDDQRYEFRVKATRITL